jgi:hypothetical protein
MRTRAQTSLLALALALAAPLARAQEPGAAQNDTLDPLRERFRAGLDKYRAGAFAEAILIWETIYRELGPEKGYRLAFNLARAYEQFGDPTRAAESYDAYVAGVAEHRKLEETLDPNVEVQEAEALKRLAELDKTQGRIRVVTERSVLVKIDRGPERLVPPNGWVAHVTPGRSHVVTFDPGTPSERHVEVKVEFGQIVEVSPPPRESPPSPPPPSVVPTPPREAAERHPYSATVMWIAAGGTLVSAVLPIVLYARAGGIRTDYEAAVTAAEGSARSGDSSAYDAARSRGTGLRSDYESARSVAQLSLAVPITLGAVTGSLAAYWFFGAKSSSVTGFVTPLHGGAFMGHQLSF